MNWLQGLVYGIVTGLTEFLPVSAAGHQRLLLLLTGGESSPLVDLLARLGGLAALVLSCWPQLSRLRRERRVAALPARRRRRQPDIRALQDMRFLKTALVPLLLGFALYPWTMGADGLWLTALLLAVNGILLYLPPYFPSGNKNSRSVSGLDAAICGLSGVLGVLPGMSRLTGIVTAGQLRGCSRDYILDMGLMLSIPALAAVCIFDFVALITAGAVTGALVLAGFLALLTAFAGAYFGIQFLRFLAVRVGFSGFAYYSWGAALFTFILYLMV